MNKTILLFSLICLMTGPLFGQNQVSGLVTDKSGQPIPGVNILIRGTSKGTLTSIDGTYKINVPKDSTLLFSFVGMLSQEVLVGNQSEINVTLMDDIKSLEDVVVVGYGVQKREHVTGSLATITSKDIQDIPSANLSTSLEGRLSGVRISQQSGKPGAYTYLQIRESSSYGEAAEEPLYVIDDVATTKDAFDILDPSEVESVSVLKDAAAAVFGVRSAGGVVLVRTKRGKLGKMKVNYSGSYGITKGINTTEMLSAYDQAVMLNDAANIRKAPLVDNARFTDDELAYLKDSIPGGGYDWLKKAWRSSSLTRHNLNFSGGTEKVRYFVGGNYLKETGFISGLNISKYTLRSSLEADVFRGFTASLEVDLGNRKSNTPIDPSVSSETTLLDQTFKTLLQNPQWIPPTIDGLPVYNNGAVDKNPYATWTNNDYNKGESNSSNIIGSVNYKIPFIKGLSIKLQYSQTKTSSASKIYKVKAYAYNFLTSGGHAHIVRPNASFDTLHAPRVIISRTEQLEESTEQTFSYQGNAYLNYANKFGRHDISAVLVYEVSENNGQRVGWQRNGEQMILGVDEPWAFKTGNDVALTTNAAVGGRSGYVGRLDYNFGSKYLVEITARYEASTRFSPGNRWGLFPAALLGWVVSEENFFKNNLQFINFFKLRGSAGLLGNDNIQAFEWMLGYTPTNLSNSYLFGNINSTPLEISANNAAFYNPDVKWQKTQSYNGGFDAKFFNNKITMSVDGFYKYTYDILAQIASQMPTTEGVSSSSHISFNYGIMHAYGYELELGYNGKLPFNFEYYIKGNYSFAAARKLKVAQNPAAVGKWYDELKNYSDNQPGIISTGIVRSQNEVDDIMMDNPNYKIGTQNLEPGMLNYKDIRGADGSDGPNGSFNNAIEEDRTIIATHTDPTHYYGSTMGLSWRGIRLDMTFSGKFGNKVFYDREAITPPTAKANSPSFWKDHWSPQNPNAAYPRATQYGEEGQVSTFWMRNGHTLRLTDLNLSYSLPAKWAAQFGVPQLRIFFSTQYLWTIISPFSYKDPGISSYNDYPMTRAYNFGLTVSL